MSEFSGAKKENRPARYNTHPMPPTGATVVGRLSAAIAREMSKRPETGTNPASFELGRRTRLSSVRAARTALLSKVGNPAQLRSMSDEAALARLKSASARFNNDDAMRDVVRSSSVTHEFPVSEEQRREILRQVREAAQGESSAILSTTEVRGQLGKDMYGTYAFRSPMDRPENKHVREGMSFTAAHRHAGSQNPSVVIDYRFQNPGNKDQLAMTRVAVQPELAFQIMDVTSGDPAFAREVAGTVLNVRTMIHGGEETLDPLLATKPVGEVQIFDGITQGTLQGNADKLLGDRGETRLYPPADIHLHYPVHATAQSV